MVTPDTVHVPRVVQDSQQEPEGHVALDTSLLRGVSSPVNYRLAAAVAAGQRHYALLGGGNILF